MKAIVKKIKDNRITLVIIQDTKTEKNFIKAILQNHEEFILKLRNSINFIVHIVKCDTCEFNEFHEEVDGTNNGEHCKVKLGKCNNPDIEFWKNQKISNHRLENEFCSCIHYKPKK